MLSRSARKLMLKTALLLAVALALTTFAGNYYISSYAKAYLYDSIDELPSRKVGVVLGTSKYTSSGTRNTYFEERIKAAARLYEAGKISYILVSGDNRQHSYNEPKDMQKALLTYGIPKNRIIYDFAGRRTLDSVLRTQMIFQQNSFIIISQKFQNERAVFIARQRGADAIAFNAAGKADLKMNIREFLSRARCVVDVLITRAEPQVMGPPISIPEE